MGDPACRLWLRLVADEPNAWLAGAGSRRLEGTNIKAMTNAEAWLMLASRGPLVETGAPVVKLGWGYLKPCSDHFACW